MRDSNHKNSAKRKYGINEHYTSKQKKEVYERLAEIVEENDGTKTLQVKSSDEHIIPAIKFGKDGGQISINLENTLTYWRTICTAYAEMMKMFDQLVIANAVYDNDNPDTPIKDKPDNFNAAFKSIADGLYRVYTDVEKATFLTEQVFTTFSFLLDNAQDKDE